MPNTEFIEPFIKKFKLENCFYIYDVNTNQIINTDKITYEIINDFKYGKDYIINKFGHKFKIKDIHQKFNYLKKMETENDFFSSHRPEISSVVKSIEEVKQILESNMKQIILELTTQCNNKCKYCSVSGKYLNHEAVSLSDMPISIAKKSIDFFIAHGMTQETGKFSVSFYGGEPLLKFNSIKQILSYVKKNYPGQKFQFSFTTNGILLDQKEIIDFLIENDISILVSLDGPKYIHDRYRIMNNGEGSFDIVMNNLIKLKKYNPHYFLKNVRINAVISPPFHFRSLIYFFFRRNFFEEIRDKIKFSFVDTSETTFVDDFELVDDIKILDLEIEKALKRYQRALISGTYNKLTFEKDYFLHNFYRIACRKMSKLEDCIIPAGTCFPGERRLFISTEGKFFMCEKIGKNYSIGNIKEGFDYGRIYNFFKEYQSFFADCRNCWGLRFCIKCFTNVKKGENFDTLRRDQFCNLKRDSIEKYLQIYCKILKKNATAFNVFKNIRVS